MEKFYYELFFKVKEEYKQLFLDFIFDLGIEAVEERDGGLYIRSSENLDDLVWALELFSKKLSQREKQNFDLNIILERKENKDWIEEYKKSIQPIMIDKVYIHTAWHKKKEDCINIQIDPALAFGSGHHETTYSCIKLLQKFAKKDDVALDLGCGSGILAIILAKLGSRVDVCDTDELAIKSAESNAKINGVSLENSYLGSLTKTTKKYDFLVANIIADVILILEKDIKNHLNENAILILSGILDKYETRVKDKFKDMKLVDEIKMNEWYSLVYKKGK